jgi:RHS repeat-associated protein
MFTNRFHQAKLALVALLLVANIFNSVSAGECKSKRVTIDKLWFATTLYYGNYNPPSYDVYQFSGRSFPLEDAYSSYYNQSDINGVSFESEEDFSMEIEEGKPTQITMGNADTENSYYQYAKVSFACGVTRVDVNGYMFSVENKDDAQFQTITLPFALISKVSFKRQECGAVLEVILLGGAGGALTVTPYKALDDKSCSGDEQAGTPSSEPGPGENSSCISASFSSGQAANGVTNGLITWRANTASAAISVGSFYLPGVADDPLNDFLLPGTTYKKTATRLQYKTYSQLFDAETVGDDLVVKFYGTQNLGNQTDGFYNPGSGLLKTIIYARFGNQVSVTKIEGGVTELTHLLEWSSTGAGADTITSTSWTDLAQSRKIVTICGSNGSNTKVTSEEWNTEGSSSYSLISRVSREYDASQRLVQTTTDPVWPGRLNAANIVESLQYETEGNIERSTFADGSWSIDTQGADANFSMPTGVTSQTVTYTPWLNTGYPATGLPALASCVARVSRVGPDGETVETWTAGVMSASEETSTSLEGGYTTVSTKTYTDSSHFLLTKSLTYPSGCVPAINSGRLFRTIDASGRTTTYSYAKMSFNAVNGLFQEDAANGTFLATYSTEGTVGNESGLLDADGNALTTRTLTIEAPDGKTVRSEVQAYIGSGSYDTMTVTRYERSYNLDGSVHTTSTYQDNRLISEEETVSRNVTRLTDEQGILEIRATDSKGRTATLIRQGITTTYSYAGLTTTATQTASGMTPRTTTSIRNLVGDVISETDASGVTTTYSKDPLNRTDTTTRNGVTTTTARYIDGQPMSVSGTGVIPSYSTYLVASNGFITTKQSTGTGDSHSARWTETTVDWAGRTRTVTRPGTPAANSARNPDIVTTYWYDSIGAQYKTTTTAGPSPVLSISDPLGSTTSSGLDVNGDNNLNPANNDRVSTTRLFYQKVSGGAWWQVNVQNTAISATTSHSTTSRRCMNVGAGDVSINTDPSGDITTTRSIDRASQTITTTVASLDGTQTTIEVGGLLKSQTIPGIANPATYDYDNFGREVHRTDPRGASTWTFHYNGSSQLDHVTDHLGHTTTYLYYSSNHVNAGQIAKVTDQGGGCTEYVYNSRGQTTEIKGNATYHQAFGYDAQGDQFTLDTYGTVPATTIWHKDAATGLLTFKEYADGNGTHYSYTPDGKVDVRTWQRGVTTTYSYDSVTRDKTNIDYSDSTPAVEFLNFDLLGRPGTVTEARSTDDVTSLTYDPVTGSQSASYAAGHSVLPNLAVVANASDSRGRATGYSVTKDGDPIHGWTYGYDSVGRMGGVSSGTMNVVYGYQPGTLMVKDQTTSIGTSIIHHSTRAIDLLGRSVGMVSRAPNPATGGSMRIVASVGHEYDERHRRKNARREDGTRWDYGYNDRSEVTSAIKSLPDSQLVPGQSFGYNFDGMGNRTTPSAGTGSDLTTANYTPDALNRYTGITTPGFADILVRSPNSVTVTAAGANAPVTQRGNLYNAHATIANSPNGNYYGVTVTDGTTTRSGSRWLAPASVSPVPDEDGNLKQDGRWSYTWDAENRLVQLSTLTTAITAGAPDLTLNYTYDYLGRRIRKTVTTAGTPPTTTEESTLYEGWNPVATFSGGTLTKTLLWGLDLSGMPQGAGGVGGLVAVTDHVSSSSDCYIPSFDTNGNVIAWTDSTGLLIRRQDFDPFGNTMLKETMVTRAGLDAILTHGFSTKPTDLETGLLYYGYRFYDPVTGRWLSRDPIGEKGGVNLYGLVNNNPLNNVDILGNKGYLVYRRLALHLWGGVEKYPITGHVYLAFTEEGATEQQKKEWNKGLSNLGMRRQSVHTFSFHPTSVYINRAKNDGYVNSGIPDGDRLSVVYTNGSYVDIDEKDHDIKEYNLHAEKREVASNWCDQLKLFNQAIASARTNNGGLGFYNNPLGAKVCIDYGGSADPDTYSFTDHNCAHWAWLMAKRAGLTAPNLGTYIRNTAWNGGVGMGGLLDPFGRVSGSVVTGYFKSIDMFSR